ncbi:MAG: beta-galactosidase [Chloroflexi bacterium]|nr:beta-galactosidase [Chloroflexota bacterium]
MQTIRDCWLWLARALVAWVLLSWAAPPRVLVAPGPPQTVRTRHPLACVHTRLTDEVEPWKIQRTLQLVREMGAPTIVEYFPWAYVEAHRGSYDWRHVDAVLDMAANQGLTVVARLGMVPAWARPEPDVQQTVDSYLAPEGYSDFAEFVYQFVRHTAGRVKYIVVWNEPNLALEWGFRPVDPEAYTALLRLAYARAKQANPAVVVLGGALAPTLEPVGSEFGMNDLDYLRRMYAAGAKDSFDVLAAHAYGLTFPPEAPPAPDETNFRRVELLRQVMAENGDSDRPLMITESGWNDSPRWTKAVKPGVRIDYTLRAVEWAEAHWPDVLAVCTWAFRLPSPARGYMDYYTFVTPDFQLRPIYEAYREWAGGR